MSPVLPAYFIRHLGPNLHMGFESAIYGYDCQPDCRKIPEIRVFFRVLGEPGPLFIGP